MTTLRRFRSSKSFKAALQLIFSFTLAFVLIMSIRMALGVENPIFVVSSGSMYPTLNIGDLIVVQRAAPNQLEIGDIVVFMDPYARLKAPIVHRIVDIIIDNSGNYKIATTGDALGVGLDQFSPWDASLLIGKVIMRFPYIGNIYLPLLSEKNIIIRGVFIIIALIIIVLVSFFSDKDKKGSQREKSWGHARLMYILTVNLLLMCLLLFSLWGLGAHGLGMFGEYQVNVKKYGSENVLLTIGFMTYRIDVLMHGTIRQGVLTFSWFQFLFLVFILFNLVEIVVPFARLCLNKRFSL